MTPRCSVRAAAREIYGELNQGEAGGLAASNTPSSPSPGSGAADPPSLRFGTASLTAKARQLYEGSAVPVVEIARLCGVTDRTIYKYAAKQRWKPRYRWTVDDGRPAAFAPAKGAGGRFIRRDDNGKPFAQGLKATDPAGRAGASSVCAKAARLARKAQAEAEYAERLEEELGALTGLDRAAGALVDYLDGCKKARRATPDNDPVLRSHNLWLSKALDECEAALALKKQAASRLKVRGAARGKMTRERLRATRAASKDSLDGR